MTDHDDRADLRMRVIADVLGIPVERFYGLQSAGEVDDANECLRLWYALKTAEGRAAALDALRKIAAEEDE